MQIYCKMEVLRDMHLPPGFGFHPSDTELVSHYLKRKILGQKIEYDPIPEVDIYKHEPWDLPGRSNHAFIVLVGRLTKKKKLLSLALDVITS
jgi:hypothetical protein